MSEIKVSRSEVDEERYFAVLDEKQLEQLIANAVAAAAGVNLGQRGVYVKNVFITSRDSSTGPRKEARCEIVVDHRRPERGRCRMNWTKEEEARLRTLWASGSSFKVIGAELGRSADAAYRKGKAMGLGSKPFDGEMSPTWMLLVRVCQDRRGRTVHQMAQITGATRGTIDHLMLRKERAGEAHVVGWEKRAGAPIPYWLPFPGKSKPKPRAMTNAERNRARYARLREEDPLRYKAMIERNSINRARRNGSVRKQHAVVRALFAMGRQA